VVKINIKLSYKRCNLDLDDPVRGVCESYFSVLLTFKYKYSINYLNGRCKYKYSINIT